MVAQAIGTARAGGASGPILVRGVSAYGNRKVVRACRRAGAQFSLVMTRNPAVDRALAAIDEDAWTPVSYPGAVRDPDTGVWISDAEVAEISYTAFASTPDRITARLVVRRVKDARFPDALFPVWRYHPFFTNTDLPVEAADITHRQHAIIETVFADLIDGPWHTFRRAASARTPPGSCARRSRTTCCAPLAYSPVHAIPEHEHRRCAARSSTSRLDWPDPNTGRSCTYPPTGRGQSTGLHCGATPSDTAHHPRLQPDHRRQGPTGAHRKSWTEQRLPHAHTPPIKINKPRN